MPAIGKFSVPLIGYGSFSASAIIDGFLTYLSFDSASAASLTRRLDSSVSETFLLQLMSVSLTAGGLMLAIWGLVAARRVEIKAGINGDAEKAAVDRAIDGFLSASFAWLLAFSAFLASYIFEVGLDDIVELSPDDRMASFTRLGFEKSLEVVGSLAVSTTLYITGMLMLIAGTWSGISAIEKISPQLSSS